MSLKKYIYQSHYFKKIYKLPIKKIKYENLYELILSLYARYEISQTMRIRHFVQPKQKKNYSFSLRVQKEKHTN